VRYHLICSFQQLSPVVAPSLLVLPLLASMVECDLNNCHGAPADTSHFEMGTTNAFLRGLLRPTLFVSAVANAFVHISTIFLARQLGVPNLYILFNRIVVIIPETLDIFQWGHKTHP